MKRRSFFTSLATGAAVVVAAPIIAKTIAAAPVADPFPTTLTTGWSKFSHYATESYLAAQTSLNELQAASFSAIHFNATHCGESP